MEHHKQRRYTPAFTHEEISPHAQIMELVIPATALKSGSGSVKLEFGNGVIQGNYKRQMKLFSYLALYYHNEYGDRAFDGLPLFLVGCEIVREDTKEAKFVAVKFRLINQHAAYESSLREGAENKVGVPGAKRAPKRPDNHAGQVITRVVNGNKGPSKGKKDKGKEGPVSSSGKRRDFPSEFEQYDKYSYECLTHVAIANQNTRVGVRDAFHWGTAETSIFNPYNVWSLAEFPGEDHQSLVRSSGQPPILSTCRLQELRGRRGETAGVRLRVQRPLSGVLLEIATASHFSLT